MDLRRRNKQHVMETMDGKPPAPRADDSNLEIDELGARQWRLRDDGPENNRGQGRVPDGKGRRRHPSAPRGTAVAACHVNSVTKLRLSHVPRKITGDLRLDERKINSSARDCESARP